VRTIHLDPTLLNLKGLQLYIHLSKGANLVNPESENARKADQGQDI